METSLNACYESLGKMPVQELGKASLTAFEKLVPDIDLLLR